MAMKLRVGRQYQVNGETVTLAAMGVEEREDGPVLVIRYRVSDGWEIGMDASEFSALVAPVAVAA